MTPPTTAPQTAPVLPIPPPKPKAIRGMTLSSVSIPKCWHTARRTDSLQVWPWAMIRPARSSSIARLPWLVRGALTSAVGVPVYPPV
jgi:hypothetical protein